MKHVDVIAIIAAILLGQVETNALQNAEAIKAAQLLHRTATKLNDRV